MIAALTPEDLEILLKMLSERLSLEMETKSEYGCGPDGNMYSDYINIHLMFNNEIISSVSFSALA